MLRKNKLYIILFLLLVCITYLLYKKYSFREQFQSSNDWNKDTELIIVSAHYNEDLTWLTRAPVPIVVCGKEGEKKATISSNPKCKTINEGNEASSYIKFIIEYYDQLPQYMLFIHGHETSPHQKVDIFDEIKNRKWLNNKYYSVNKNGFFDSTIGPQNEIYVVDWIKEVWDAYFRPHLARDPPARVRTDCCAQFIISRDAILKYSKETWQKWYLFLTNEYKNYPNILKTSRDAAIVFEYMWHIIFGQPDEIKEL